MTNKKKGILFLTVPVATIAVVMFSFALVSAIFGSSADLPVGSWQLLTLSIANYILGLIGLLAVIGVIVGVPVGIVLLCTKDSK